MNKQISEPDLFDADTDSCLH